MKRRTHLRALNHERDKLREINDKLNCDDNCLTCFLTCKCCGKQYVKETTDGFRLRWNNYKSNDKNNERNEACMQGHLLEHFKIEGHGGFLGNVSMTLIDKEDRKDPKKRENYWMKTAYASFGINIEDGIRSISCRIITVAGGFTFLIFFGILFRPGT